MNTENQKHRLTTVGKGRGKEKTGETHQEHRDTKEVKNIKRGD